MAKSYWLVKQEPTKYPFEKLVADRKTTWDGVRNYQARNNLQAMQKGDRVLYYHSNVGQEVVGVCEVSRAAFQDPTTDDARWGQLELRPDAIDELAGLASGWILGGDEPAAEQPAEGRSI